MSEIPDVVTGETITSEWGNDIRDRVIQRYATAAARLASVPTPAEGDLSYLLDTNTVYVFTGAAWEPVAANLEGPVRAGTLTDVTASALITSFQTKASVSFNMPNSWSSYQVVAWATVSGIVNNPTGSGVLIEAKVAIGASDGPTVSAGIGVSGAGEATAACTHSAGSSSDPLTIAVQVRETGSHASYEWSTISYIAYRLT